MGFEFLRKDASIILRFECYFIGKFYKNIKLRQFSFLCSIFFFFFSFLLPAALVSKYIPEIQGTWMWNGILLYLGRADR